MRVTEIVRNVVLVLFLGFVFHHVSSRSLLKVLLNNQSQSSKSGAVFLNCGINTFIIYHDVKEKSKNDSIFYFQKIIVVVFRSRIFSLRHL